MIAIVNEIRALRDIAVKDFESGISLWDDVAVVECLNAF